MPVANTTYVWGIGQTNPDVLFDHPVILVGYAIDVTANADNIHVRLCDSTAGDGSDAIMHLPGPAGLGANTFMPQKFSIGISIEVVDDADNDVTTGTGSVTLSVFDPTL